MTDGTTPGPRLAVGRTAEVFEWGDGRVLKLLRPEFPDALGVAEAAAAGRASASGLAAPRFLGTERLDGRFGLVYERVEGPSMLEVVLHEPDRAGTMAAALADLHAAMHARDAGTLPDFHDRTRRAIDQARPHVDPPAREEAIRRLERLPQGHAILHGDLHPGNVLLTADGPMVIDWSNASAGDPTFDVADTWVLFACASAPMRGIDRVIVPIGRRVLLRSFLHGVDTGAARRAIPAAVAHRLTDRNMTVDEHARMRELAAWAVRS
jgi:uncharacterized protein (TIGR02172 family)